MTPPEPWPEILAAYADGELTPADRAAVDRYLHACPEARALLRTQREWSPANERFWAECEPPAPHPTEWAAVRAAVAAEVLPARTAWRRWVVPAVAAAAVLLAGAAVWLATGPRGGERPPAQPEQATVRAPAPPEPAPMPREPEAVAKVTDDAGDEPFVLAGAGDVDVAAVGPHPAWPGDTPPPMGGPADAPIIYAAGLR